MRKNEITVTRLEDIPRDRIPWKEMKVGGIYQCKRNGKYFIYAGRSDVYHNVGDSMTRVSEPKYYTYIYIDYPNVLVTSKTDEKIKILASSAKVRSSEYRDIARTFIGMIPGFDHQTDWEFSTFTIKTDPTHQVKGSTKFKVKYTAVDQLTINKKLKGLKPKATKSAITEKPKPTHRRATKKSTKA